MNAGTFVLSFSETVNISTFTPSQLILVDTADPNPFTSYQLKSNGTLITDDDSPVVTFQLDDNDLNAIKLDGDLFDALSTSYISLLPNTVIDMSDNHIMAINFAFALRASNYTFDETRPALVGYEIDLNSSTITLTFDESVDIDEFNPSVINLLSASNNSVRSYQIVGDRTSTTIDSLGLEVRFDLTLLDQDNLKAFEDFATEPNNTFLYVGEDLITDLSRFQNKNQPITEDNPLMAVDVKPDLIAPELVSFLLLDFGTGTLQLSFNEPVNASSVQFDLVTILVSPGSPYNHSLINGSTSYVPDTLHKVIEIALSEESLFALKTNTDLASGRISSYIQLAGGAIEDQGGNNVLNSAFLQVDTYQEDRTGPTAQGFVLNMNSGTLLISFDDVVDTDSLIINNIAVQADINGAAVDNFVQLNALPTFQATYSPNGFEVLINIPPASLNLIKANDQLATRIDNSFLRLTAQTLNDFAGNPAIPFVRTAALPATDHVADITSPELISFDLDIDGTGQLTLTFSEAVVQNNLVVSELILVGESSESYALTSTNYPLNPPLASFTIILGGTLSGFTTPDLNIIKSLASLASLETNVYLTLSSFAVKDTSGNNVTAITHTPLPVTPGRYFPDRTPPELKRFELDMDRGVLFFTFSETVNGSSFNPEVVMLRSSQVFVANSYTLTGGYWEPAFSDRLSLNLTTEDLNEVKRILGLADSQSTTYLSFTADMVTDMASGVSESDLKSNPIVPLETFEALAAGDYVIDSTSPFLTGFSLNLTTETLQLTFDETVDASSLRIDLISLLSMPVHLGTENEADSQDILSGSGSSSGNNFGSGSGEEFEMEPAPLLVVNLTVGSENSSSSFSQNGTIITIQLGSDDLNSLKLFVGLATASHNTYISFTEDTIHDTSLNSNPVVSVLPEEAIQASTFGEDLIPPELARFDLNLTSGILFLTFSEVVNASSINLDAITLQGAFAAEGGSLADAWTLTDGLNGSTTSLTDGTEIIVYLGWTDLNEIKRLKGIATASSDTYVTITSQAVKDMNGNAVFPRLDGISSLPVAFFTEDFVRPELVVFNVDMDSGGLTLEFSETVEASSLNVTGISLLSSRNVSEAVVYTLTSGSVTSSNDNTTIAIRLSREDQNAIKYYSELVQDENSTFLSLASLTITDMDSNPVISILPAASLTVSTYIRDETGPILESFDLNLTSEMLTLHFDETVNVSSLRFTHLTILSSTFIPAVNYSLMAGLVVGDNTPNVIINLDFEDLNRLKLDPRVATGSENTFLSLREGAVLDLSLSPNRAQGRTHPVSNFTRDMTRPNLLAFTANLNHGTLTLNFDEPVSTSTFDPMGITLASTMDGGSSLALTGGNTTSYNGLQVVVNLSDDDLNEIKVLESLYTDSDNVYISLEPLTIADMNGNPVNAVFLSDALNATSFINDTTSPRLLAFDLDFNSDILTLEFVETVNTSSIHFNGITLQSTSNSSNIVNLTGGNLLSLADSTIVQLRLLKVDSNLIKSEQIALTRNTTWLTLESFTITDQNDQPLLPLINGINATFVRNYTQDDTHPILDRFQLNLTANTLTLEFSETVDVINTLYVPAITLLAGPNADFIGLSHTLGLDNSTLSSDVFAHVVTIQLGRLDLNELKKLIDLATSESNTYIAVDTSAVADTKLNPVVAIPTFVPLQVTNYTEDNVRPELEEFDLDMDTSILTLSFSETVNPKTLDLTQFQLQFAKSVSFDSEHVLRFTGGVASTADPTPWFSVAISTPDLNNIKRIPILATTEDNAYMRLGMAGLQDMNENYMAALTHDNALSVRNFTPDITRPELVSYDLNLSSERLILTFSETVNSSSFDPTGIIILESQSATSPNLRNLGGGSVLTSFDTIVQLQLDASDLNYMKSIADLASSKSNTYLTLSEYTIEDMFGNMVVTIASSEALEVNNYTEDDRSPVLLSFDLDMDRGIIDLTFNETVYVPSLRVDEITIQNYANFTAETSFHVFNPSANTTSASTDQPVITVNIGLDDLNEIKRLSDLSTSEVTTFLNLTFLAIADTNENQLTPTILLVTNFTEDTTKPELLSFSFDLNTGELQLDFSETVNVSSLDPSQLKLQSISNISESGASTLTLAGGDVLTTMDSTTVTIKLLKHDLDVLKAVSIGTNVATTFLSVTSDLVLDMNNNNLVFISDTNAKMAQNFINDTTRPFLVDYSIDLNVGILTLTFSEAVDTATLNLTQLTLQDASIPMSSFTPFSSTHSLDLQPIVTVYLNKTDLDLLKENRDVGTGTDDTFLSFTSITVSDTAGNPVIPIPSESGKQVANYTSDITAPRLEGFDFDVDSGLLVLSYSETIDILAFDSNLVVLQSHTNQTLSLHTLTLSEGELLKQDGTTASFTLSVTDLNEVKRLIYLATCTADNTFLSLIPNENVTDAYLRVPGVNDAILTSSENEIDESGSGQSGMKMEESGSGVSTIPTVPLQFSAHVYDMAGNPVESVWKLDALKVSECQNDTTSPQLVNFTLNMHNSTLTLTFDETMNVSSLDVTEISFFNGASNASDRQTYRLQSGYTEVGALLGQVVLEVVIANTDLNEIKRRSLLGTNTENTRISISRNLIRDMNGNKNLAIFPESALIAESHIADERRPSLLLFSLDLTSETLTLSFSETVNASSLVVGQLTLLNENSTSMRTLEGGYFVTRNTINGPNDPIIVIQLYPADLNYIKSVRDLATNVNDTFLSIEAFAIADMNGNLVVPINTTSPQPVTKYVQDMVPPQLLSFDLNIDSFELFLTFSETVDVSSLNVSAISLQPTHLSPPEEIFSFTAGNTNDATFSSSYDLPEIIINIGIDDMNEIKRRRDLATSNDTTFLALKTHAILDMNGNEVVSITNSNATQVTNYTEDLTNPILDGFTIDMNQGTLQLTFNETVSHATLNFTLLTLQSWPVSDSISIALSGGNTTNILDSTVVYVSLTAEDLNILKRIRFLATNITNTYLSIAQGAVLDMNNNTADAVLPSAAIVAANVTEDVMNPELISFDLDMNLGALYLTFDETVEASSFNVSAITLQDSTFASGSEIMYTLTGGESSIDDSTLIAVNFSFYDLNEIKKLRGLASNESGSNTFITITNYTIEDMNANSVVPIPNGMGLQVSNFFQDITSPELLHFDLDLNTGILTLVFSETVDTYTFNISQFSLQGEMNISAYPTHLFSLTEESLLTGDEVIIEQQLLYFDLNTIKSLNHLATNDNDTYISLTELALRDMVGNQVVPISSDDALSVRNYTVDITRPLLLTFDLDLDQGAIDLTFSETVNVTTLQVMEVTLISHITNATQQFRLTYESGSTSRDWPFFTIDIGPNDLNTIKALAFLATQNTSTYIQLTESVIRDTAGNMNLPTNITMVTEYTPDTTDPKLLEFDLDLTQDILTLRFSETINAGTFNASQLTLVSSSEDQNSGSGHSGYGPGYSVNNTAQSGSGMASDALKVVSYSLTGGELISFINSTQLQLALSFTDRNELKRLLGLAISTNTTYLSATSSFVEDTATNPIQPIDISSPILVSNFTVDVSQPTLLRFELDMDAPTLTLFLSETVDVSSLNMSAITLQSTRNFVNGMTESHTFMPGPSPFGSNSVSEDGPTVVINVGEDDANAIKFLVELAQGQNSTFLSLLPNALTDTNGNQVVVVPESNATSVRTFERDEMGPMLRGFSLDLTSELLILTFDETVDFSSLSSMLLTFHSNLSDPKPYRLQSVVPIGLNSPILVLNLTATHYDLNQLKLRPDLAIDETSTYIQLVDGAIFDLSLPPNPISLSPLTQAGLVFPDQTPPNVISFTANLDTGTLTLVFDEVVNTSSLDVTAVRLQNSANGSGSYFQLTGT